MEIEFVPRIPHIPSYPCGPQCHDEREPNRERRQLTELHTRIHLNHGAAIEWCDFCHDLDHPERLKLIDGTLVSFDASYQLCSQCHGERVKDFREGVHGTQTGSWNGVAKRRLCTACHDPHEPGPISLTALPAPRRARAGEDP